MNHILNCRSRYKSEHNLPSRMNNLSSWRRSWKNSGLTRNQTLTLIVMTGCKTLSIELIKQSGEQAIVSLLYELKYVKRALCLVSYHHTNHLNCTCSSCNTPHLRSFDKEIHSICRFYLASNLNVFILRTVYGFLQYDIVSFFTLPSWIHEPLVRCNPLKNTEYFFSCSSDKKNISLFTHSKRNRFSH